jgi:hypothetical protein
MRYAADKTSQSICWLQSIKVSEPVLNMMRMTTAIGLEWMRMRLRIRVRYVNVPGGAALYGLRLRSRIDAPANQRGRIDAHRCAQSTRVCAQAIRACQRPTRHDSMYQRQQATLGKSIHRHNPRDWWIGATLAYAYAKMIFCLSR